MTPPTYADLAGMIDHALLHPTLTDADLRLGCDLAARYQVATVCIKPYAIWRAVEWLEGTRVAVGTVIGFPHGSNAPEVKRFETQQACLAGAKEIDVVANIGAVLSGDWELVADDLFGVCDEAHGHGARVKVIFETGFLLRDEDKAELCRRSARAGAEWVKTSTGFGFVKAADGTMQATGATEADLRLMLASVPTGVQVKASGGVRDLDALLQVRALGCTRCGTSSTAAILDEYRRREAGGIIENTGRLDSGY